MQWNSLWFLWIILDFSEGLTWIEVYHGFNPIESKYLASIFKTTYLKKSLFNH